MHGVYHHFGAQDTLKGHELSNYSKTHIDPGKVIVVPLLHILGYVQIIKHVMAPRSYSYTKM